MNKEKIASHPRLLLGAALLAFLVAVPVLSKAAGGSVLVDVNPDKTHANLVKDLSAISIKDVENCVTPEKLKNYYGGSKSKYIGIKAKEASCATKVMKTTNYQSQLAAVEASITGIDMMIVSTNKTAQYLNIKKSLDGISLYAIPAGAVENKPFELATGIAMKCLNKKDTNVELSSDLRMVPNEQIPYGGAVGAIGNLSIDDVSLFNQMPESQLAALEKFAKELEILKGKIEAEKAANNGEMSMKIAMSFGSRLGSMTDTIAKHTIMITPEDMVNYDSMIKYMRNERHIDPGFGISYNFDKSGKKQDHELSGMYAMAASVMGVTDKVLIDSSLSLGNITFPETWLPESSTLTGLKDKNEAHKARLTKLREKFTKLTEQYKEKLAALDKDTSCN